MTALEFADRPDRFLPFKACDLLARMLEDPRLAAQEREQLRQLFDTAAARVHGEFYRQVQRLDELYDAFDPDRETLALAVPSEEELAARRGEFAKAFEKLLNEGNYDELSRDDLVRCVDFQSRGGLVVRADLSEYADLRVFYRGLRHQRRTLTHRFLPWKKVIEPIHVFSRAAILVRMHGQSQDRILLKLFKNVVVEDLEMVLPTVRVCMRWFDTLKIGSSMAGGVATAGWKAFTAAILSPAVFLVVLFTFITAAVKGVFSFFANKTRYMQTLTAHLYFQNLANNASVISTLADAAEAEEAKELMLAYFLLYVERDRDYTLADLNRRASQWLLEQFGAEVDFEGADALRKLLQKRFAVERDPAAAHLPARHAALAPAASPAVLVAPASAGGEADSRRIDEAAGGASSRPATHLHGNKILKVYDLPTALRRLATIEAGATATAGSDDRLANAAWPPPGEGISARAPHFPQGQARSGRADR